MKTTHTDDCCHERLYTGDEEGEPDPWVGIWNQPQGFYVDEAKAEAHLDDTDHAPWCRIRHRAWKLQRAAGE